MTDSTEPLETQSQSLAVLRARARAMQSIEELRRYSAALSRDTRSGALRLAESCERRASEHERKARHLERLLQPRAGLYARGARCVAGVDEVGMGPLAGPVVAAAVVLPDELPALAFEGLDDSKKVPVKSRERLDRAIREHGVAVSVAEVSPEEIERLNIFQAGLEAMRRAVAGLALPELDHLLVDARRVPGVSIQQTAIVRGDSVDASIAAASIVAKVHRDALMRELDASYPGYGFAQHMGYGTAQHLEALQRLGPSPVHRRSFAPVAEAGARFRANPV